MENLKDALLIPIPLSPQRHRERGFNQAELICKELINLDKENNQYYFLDVEARYVVKENKLTFFLSGNNLFNTETFRNYNISDTDISKTEYRLQPRYVLLKIEFRF